MAKDFFIYFESILDSIKKIEQRLDGFDLEKFQQDEVIADSIVRQLEMIGEAARNIPENFRDEYSEIPWRRIIGLRNILIHDYLNVDLSVVWEIYKDYLPELKKQIEAILNS